MDNQDKNLKDVPVQSEVPTEEEIKQRISFFEKHLTHLLANQGSLDYQFVEQEKLAIKKVIDNLKSKL